MEQPPTGFHVASVHSISVVDMLNFALGEELAGLERRVAGN